MTNSKKRKWRCCLGKQQVNRNKAAASPVGSNCIECTWVESSYQKINSGCRHLKTCHSQTQTTESHFTHKDQYTQSEVMENISCQWKSRKNQVTQTNMDLNSKPHDETEKNISDKLSRQQEEKTALNIWATSYSWNIYKFHFSFIPQ